MRRLCCFLILAAFLSASISVYAADNASPAFDYAYWNAGHTTPRSADDSAPFLINGTYAAASDYSTVLNGKSILFFGDSLTAAYGLSSYSQSWCGMLGTNYGMTVSSASVSGSTVAVSDAYGYFPGGCFEPICQRSIPSGNFDIIFVQGSGNDWYCEIPLGSDPLSRDPYTLMGALNVTFDRLQAKHPDALIVYMTSWNTTARKNAMGLNTDNYCSAAAEVCNARDIPCFQAYDPSISGIYSSSRPFREKWFLTDSDYWHLNPAGHERYLPVIAKWLCQVVEDHACVRGFRDVAPKDWYADSVAYVSDNGIMIGTGDDRFSPNLNMNRAMLVTVLYRISGSPAPASETPFTDIPKGLYYSDAVAWAYENGITTGVSETAFAPDAPLSREELVTFFYRYFQGTAPTEDDVLSAFRDSSSISAFAASPMVWAVSEDIIHGIGNNYLAPRDIATRAQVATMLYNYNKSF